MDAFGFGFQPALATVQRAIAATQNTIDPLAKPDTHAYGYADDAFFAGPPEQVFPLIPVFAQAAADCGLLIEKPKTRCLVLGDGELPAAVREAQEAHGFEICRGWMGILGAPVGDVRPAEIASSLSEAVTPFFKGLLRPEMPSQSAVLLLRECGIPRANYIARTVPPSQSRVALKAFDDTLLKTVCGKVGITDDEREANPDVATISRMPIRHGGAGLRLIAETAEVAYIASVASAAPEICATLIETPNTKIQAEVQECHAFLVKRGFLERQKNAGGAPEKYLIPEDPEDFLPIYEDKDNPTQGLQHVLTRDLDDADFVSYLEQCADDEPKMAALRSRSAPGASGWITGLPTDPHLTLRDEDYSISFRSLVRLQPVPNMPSRCVCGKRASADHYQVCTKLCRSHNQRHHGVVRLIAKISAYEADVPTVVEQDMGFASRPDAVHHFVTGDVITDVSITHPCAASFVSAAARTQGAAAARREREKREQHRDTASRWPASVPLVFETFGAGDAAIDFVGRLNLEIVSNADRCCVHLPDQRPYIFQRLSVALQRGNAGVMREGLVRSRSVAARRILGGS
jgi:hypothetical protein